MYKISEQLVNDLLKYLTSHPYIEVYQGIQALQNLEKLEDKSEE